MSAPFIDPARLRMLDFDDLYLLKSLMDGRTLASAAKQLGLSQPAITQRMRKIERTFETPIVQRAGRNVRLTSQGRLLCTRAASALAAMESRPLEEAGLDGVLPSVDIGADLPAE